MIPFYWMMLQAILQIVGKWPDCLDLLLPNLPAKKNFVKEAEEKNGTLQPLFNQLNELFNV